MSDEAFPPAHFHESVVERFFRCLGRILFLPEPQQLLILHQSKKAALLQITERRCRFYFRFDDCLRFRLNAEFLGKDLRGIVIADIKQAGSEVDDISRCSAAKTLIPLIQLQAGCVIFMERTCCHSRPVYHNSTALGSLPYGDRCLNGFIQIFQLSSPCKVLKERIYGHLELPLHL